MSDTIWVRWKSLAGKGNSGDDVDHSLFCKHAEALDKFADSLGVRKLSAFFDTTDLQYNLSEEELPESWIAENEIWFSTVDALPALTKIVEQFRAGGVKGVMEKSRADLLEELEDCLVKVTEADRERRVSLLHCDVNARGSPFGAAHRHKMPEKPRRMDTLPFINCTVTQITFARR